MIVLNKEMTYIHWHLAQKEYFLTDNMRTALNKIHWFMSKKKVTKPLAIHIVNELMKSKYHVDFGKKNLWSAYNSRLAHIKNAKDEFKKWELDFRLRHYGMKKKLCECGCGQEVTKKKNKFINGHNAKCRDKEENIKKASYMRNIRNSKRLGTVISIEGRIPKKP